MVVKNYYWPILLAIVSVAPHIAHSQTTTSKKSTKAAHHVAVRHNKVAKNKKVAQHRKAHVTKTALHTRKHQTKSALHSPVAHHTKVTARRHPNKAAPRAHHNTKSTSYAQAHPIKTTLHKQTLHHAKTVKHAKAATHKKVAVRHKTVHHSKKRVYAKNIRYTKTQYKKYHTRYHAKHHTRKYHAQLQLISFASTDIKLPDLKMPFETGSHLLEQVDSVLHNMHYTRYKYGGNQFDMNHGVFNIDCSHYVDQLVANANPNAYNSMTHWTRSSFPASSDYYAFINKLPYDKVTRNWYHISGAGDLEPGDVIVYRGIRHSSGHVMIVTSVPKRDSQFANVYHVMVSDSASSGHGHDTRQGSGVGLGTMLVKVDPQTDLPTELAWSERAHWRNYAIEMARPIA